jgi:hypothetical protein
VAFFSFIGSAKVGWSLKSKLAPGTRCALEHGGVAPLIFDEYTGSNQILEFIFLKTEKFTGPNKVLLVLCRRLVLIVRNSLD